MATHMIYEIPDEKIEAVGEMLKYTKDKSTLDMMANAMALLEWAVEQSKQGRVIVSLHDGNGTYREADLPMLNRARELHGK